MTDSAPLGRSGKGLLIGGLVVALVASTDSLGAATGTQGSVADDRPPANSDRVMRRLDALGIDVAQDDLNEFLSLDREEQSQVLRAQGIDDPGGPLTNPQVVEYILGQVMESGSPNDLVALDLQIRSGFLDPVEAISRAQAASPSAPIISDVQLGDVRAAVPSADEAGVRSLARLQAAVHYLRPYLPEIVSEVSFVRQQVDGDPRIVIGTSGDQSAVIEALGGQPLFMGFAVEVVVLERTKDQLDSIEGAVDRQMLAEVERSEFDSRVDLRASHVLVTPRSDRARELLVTGGVLSDLIAGGEVVVGPQDSPLSPGQIRGGWETNPAVCTWGFTLGFEGHGQLATAAHCQNGLSYGWIPTTFEQAQQSGRVDAQRHDVDNAWDGDFENEIQYNNGYFREITSRTTWAAIDVDDWVCHEGMVGGYNCGQVTDTTFDDLWWVTNPERFIVVEGIGVHCEPGDSGGPWFYGNVAYGIYSGQNEDGHFCVWGAIDYAETGIGAVVRTK